MSQTTQMNGGVRAVIFDISGTVLDYGSSGPVVAFVELFARPGAAVTEAEARGPRGAHKKDHIWSILSDASVGERWSRANGTAPTRADLDHLYEEFTPIQVEVLKHHCDVIPGVPAIVAELRR